MQRRAFLTTAGVTAITAVTGCLGSGEEPKGDGHSDESPTDQSVDKNGGTDTNNAGRPNIDFTSKEEYGIELKGERECVHRSNGNIDSDGSVDVRNGTTVILEGWAEVPNPGYNVTIDDVSHESDTGKLVITTGYADAGAWNPDDDRYSDCPGVARFRAVGELVGQQPESIRLDIRDVNDVYAVDELNLDD